MCVCVCVCVCVCLSVDHLILRVDNKNSSKCQNINLTKRARVHVCAHKILGEG